MEHKGTVQLETQRLILRRFTEEDARDMYENWANDDNVTNYLTWPTHRSVEESKFVLSMWVKDYEKLEHYQWCMEWKENKQAIGSIGVVHMDDKIDGVVIGYCMGAKYWHQGIMSEALRRVIAFLFEEVKIKRIEAYHDTNNPRSGMVMQKCGMTKEGVLRQSDHNNQGICDKVVYSILNSEWKNAE